MKKTFALIIFSFIFLFCYSQNKTYEIQIEDVNNSTCVVNYLTINDSITILPDFINNKDQYFVNLPTGTHKITSIWGYKNTLIDTIVTFDESKIITLTTNNIRDLWQREYLNGFCKVYSNEGETPIIGLREDGTFLFKRFIHLGYIAYFLFESGSFHIKNNLLILNVNKYYSNSEFEANRVSYSYNFTIKNDKIVDINKYDMDIGVK